jgi:hypothetical protein
MKLTGENQSTRRKTCPSATSSTTNPKGTDPGSNLGLRGRIVDVLISYTRDFNFCDIENEEITDKILLLEKEVWKAEESVFFSYMEIPCLDITL